MHHDINLVGKDLSDLARESMSSALCSKYYEGWRRKITLKRHSDLIKYRRYLGTGIYRTDI